VSKAFAAYDKWWRNMPRRPDGVQDGFLPGDFSCTFLKDGFRLGIVGLNSASLQLTEKRGEESFEGHMVLHPSQFNAACGGDGVKWAESHHACFLMTHHPPEWLDKESQEWLHGEIHESFQLHLCGHNHETDVLQELTGGTDHAPLRWLGRSLFGLEKSSQGKLDRSHGYVAGQLRLSDDLQGEIQFMPRERRKRGKTWSLVPDFDVDLPDANERTRPFPIQVRPLPVVSGSETIRLAIEIPDSIDKADASPDAPKSPVASALSDAASPPESPDPLPRDESVVVQTEPSPKPNPKAAFIANELVQVICDQLESDTEASRSLRKELVRHLAGQTEEDPKADVDFFVRALREKLSEVMSVLRVWLDENQRIEGVEQVRRLVDAVATAGFDADWVQTLLDELEERHLHVPIETDLYLCEVIFTALYRKPATWIHERAIDHDAIRAIEPPSIKPEDRRREIRRRLVETHFKDRISRGVGESKDAYERRLDDWAEMTCRASWNRNARIRSRGLSCSWKPSIRSKRTWRSIPNSGRTSSSWRDPARQAGSCAIVPNFKIGCL
jgi:hypothetical protein